MDFELVAQINHHLPALFASPAHGCATYRVEFVTQFAYVEGPTPLFQNQK